MYELLLIRKLSGKAIALLLSYLFPVALLCRFLSHTFAGTLVAVVALYYFLFLFGETKPWTGYQLANWLDELDSSVKTAVVTSVLTVIGFLVAFRTGTEGWKVQALGQIKLRLADELDAFFSEATRLATDLKLIAQGVLRTEELGLKGVSNELLYSIDRAEEQSAEFQVKRLRLQAMAIESFRFNGSNFTMLSTMPGVVEWMDECATLLNGITEKIWITVPAGLPEEVVHRIAVFSRLVKRPAYESFIEACEENVNSINGRVGGIRGQLLSSVVRPNLNSYFELRKKGVTLIDALDTFNKRKV